MFLNYMFSHTAIISKSSMSPDPYWQHSLCCHIHSLYFIIRVQREQILAKPETGLDPGLPEGHFSLEPSELSGETERELQRLRQDKAKLEGQLQEAQEQVAQRRDGLL